MVLVDRDVDRPPAAERRSIETLVLSDHWPGRLPSMPVSELDDLHRATGTPVTGRMSWLRACVAACPDESTVAVLIRDRRSGRLDGAVVLGWHEAGDQVAAHEPGFGAIRSGSGHIAVRHPAAGPPLAAAVAAWLDQSRRPWQLTLQGLARSHPALPALADALPHAAILPAPAVPAVVVPGVASGHDVLSASMRKQLRRSWRRLLDDGHTPSVEIHRQPEDVRGLLEEMARAHRTRDRVHGLYGELATPEGLAAWRQLIMMHAHEGSLELTTLRIDGTLASYTVGIIDGAAYRLFDGRIATGWERYSPGRHLEAVVLDRVANDPTLGELDWMTGIAAEKVLAANHWEARTTLVAGSHPAPGPTTTS